jgi:hypothetical protein
VCRPCLRSDSDCALQASEPAPPAAAQLDSDADQARPANDGPGLLRCAVGRRSSGGQGPVRAGPPPGPDFSLAADSDGEQALAQADIASGWVFWADWVTDHCGGDCWCCGGDGGGGGWGGGGAAGDEGGDGGGGGQECQLCAAAPAAVEEGGRVLLQDGPCPATPPRRTGPPLPGVVTRIRRGL